MSDCQDAADTRNATIDSYRKHLSSGLAFIAQTSGMPVEVESKGAYVWDSDGNRYLGCGGYGVFMHGYRHPKVVAAVHEQLHCHPLHCHSGLNPLLTAAAEALIATMPPYLTHVRFANSGTEAVELALKIARLNGRTRMISTVNGYHGKTLGALSVTGKPVYRDPFLPLLPNVSFIPFNDIAALETELSRDPDQACVIVEPVQAEGGVRVPDTGYLSAVSRICHDRRAMLIVDDIQAGMGRAGPMWSVDAPDIKPQVLLAGKSLGGGVMPVAAVVADEVAFEPLSRDPFVHSSTFAGNPMAMAAVSAAIASYHEDGFASAVLRIGRNLMGALGSMQSHHLLEVRGQGLLVGMEFRRPDIAIEFLLALRRHGVLASHSLNSNAVVRILPPAILEDDQVDKLVNSIDASLADIGKIH